MKVAAVSMMLAALLQQPANKQPEPPDVQELSRLENVWNEAYVRTDADTLATLCADDLVVTMSNMQVLNKQQSLAILRSGKVRFERYETSDLRIRVYDNSAVITGLLKRTRIAQGNETNDEWRFTKVYIRIVGKWQVVAWHASTAAL
jgi:hypothetical protein